MTRDPREALVAWRASTGYSQTAVGALFGVSKQGVGNWETGRARVPTRVRRLLKTEGWLISERARWTPDEDAWLLAHVGTWPEVEVVTRLNIRFGNARTRGAVERRVQHVHHTSLAVVGLLNRDQIARLCGVGRQMVWAWAERGWLELPSWSRRGMRGQWAVPPAVLEAFIAQHAVQLHPADMLPSPYQQQAAAIWARERWLSVSQVAAHAGACMRIVREWIAGGALPAVRQMRRGRFWWMIRARDLAAFLQQREVA